MAWRAAFKPQAVVCPLLLQVLGHKATLCNENMLAKKANNYKTKVFYLRKTVK